VLPVGIHLHDVRRAARERVLVSGLDARAVPEVVRMAQHARAGRGGERGGAIARAVVDDDALVAGREARELRSRPAIVAASLKAGITIAGRGLTPACPTRR
jgi:hypothetical protein